MTIAQDTQDVGAAWRERRGKPVTIGYHIRCIGTASLDHQQAFRKDLSYAAWWLQVTCAPQLVPVYSDGYYVWWTFEGIINGGNIDCRVGGVAITGNLVDRDLRKPETYRSQPYAYSVPIGKSITDNGFVHLDIDPALIGA